MIRCSLLLRCALLVDALASGLMALPMAFAASQLSALLQLPAALIFEAGLFLTPYALFVGWMASRDTLPRALVLLIVVGNALWTLGSAGLLTSGAVNPNALGYLLVGMQAAVVGVFAELQFIGLRRSQTAVAA